MKYVTYHKDFHNCIDRSLKTQCLHHTFHFAAGFPLVSEGVAGDLAVQCFENMHLSVVRRT